MLKIEQHVTFYLAVFTCSSSERFSGLKYKQIINTDTSQCAIFSIRSFIIQVLSVVLF